MSRHRFTLPIIVIAALAVMLFAVPFALAQDGPSVTPVFVAGNPSCTDLGYDFGYKPQPEPPPSGTYAFPEDGFNTVTITSDGVYFDWSSTLGIDAVIVKGGPNANVYVYDPPAESFGDTGLHSPINPNTNQPFGLSHVSFCYDYEVTVSKTAETSYTRTWHWTIDKSVSPEQWDLFTGDSGTSEYTIDVKKTGFTDSDWAVSGWITVKNLTPYAATIESVTDVVSSGISASVDCGVTFPYALASGGTLSCSYGAALPDASQRLNTATVTTSGIVGGGEGKADVVFGAPTTEVNASINVDDTNGGSWEFGDSGSVSYEKTFTCDADEGSHDNTATIRETDQSDDASVTVNCYGLDVTKDATTAYTRTWQWKIEKSVDIPEWWMFQGESGESEYIVSVEKTGYVDSNWAATGNIWVKNDTPLDATINGVSDMIDGVGAASVSCPVSFPYTLVAGETLTCSYGSSLPDATERTNTAKATLQNYDYDKDKVGTASGTTDFSGTAQIIFGDPTTVVNATIDVTDTYAGNLGSASGNYSWTYTREFACNGDAGNWQNIATITQTGQTADAWVTVNCYMPSVSKTAETLFKRTYEWMIDKSADQSELTLSPGQEYLVNYSILVDVKAFVDSDWKVEGTITVNNPNPEKGLTVDLKDEMSGIGEISLDCGGSLYVPAGESADCTYSADLPDATSRTNTATASYLGFNYVSAPVSVAFGNPSEEVDECVVLTDSFFPGSSWTVCVEGGESKAPAPYTLEYERKIGPFSYPDECGENLVENTAIITSEDLNKEVEDNWTVTVTVPCDYGCTLTPGYWKTHSKLGPAPYDENWANLSALEQDTPFFLSGQSYYQVLWTPPKGGNAYYILAHAYIAAELNFLNGADPSAVQGTFDAATALFETYTPAQVADAKGKNGKALRDQFISLAGILDSYNNGYTGPGHCSEDSSSVQ